MRRWGAPGRSSLITAAAAVLALSSAATLALSPAAFATPAPSAFRVQALCGAPLPGRAACMGLKLVPASLTAAELTDKASRQAAQLAAGVRPAAETTSPEEGFLTPQRLHEAYSLPTETTSAPSQTIAVVDAYNDPSAEADLGVYDKQFGLPACTAENGCFRKVNEEGREKPLPPTEGGWAAEISIDVQMAHAICQNCQVLLVEASSEEFVDLGRAVDAAIGLGATEVSNSYGGTEEAADTSLNESYYDHQGSVITASSGDCGYLNQACKRDSKGANFPADSPDVLAVGGTSLTEGGEGRWTSTAWSEGGSGCSSVFSAPLWQETLAEFSRTGCGSGRSIADLAAIGNPNTGIDVYDSTPEETGDPTGWTVYGGTSVASPIIAAEFGLAGGSDGVPYPAATVYAHLGDAAALYDVISGSDGKCKDATSCTAAVGYDGPTGVGSPVGLAAFSQPGTPAAVSAPTITGTPQEGETLTEHHGEWTNSPTSYGYRWEDCDAAGEDCAALAGAAGPTYQLTAGDIGSTIRVQETASNEHGFGAPSVSAPTSTVYSNVPTITAFTPSSGITGSTVRITGTALDGASAVKIDKLAAAYTIRSATEIEALVPDGAAKRGAVSVATPFGTATTKAKFAPTLSIVKLSPSSAHAGALVTIKGLGFNSSSKVSFDGTPATIVKESAKELRVTVPQGAASGPVTVANSLAPVGIIRSAGVFSPT